MPFDVFISYARKDKKFRDELVVYLSTMRSQGLISNWDDEELVPGTERERQIGEHLNKAHIILLLISPDFIASPLCHRQMQQALERYKRQSAHVIPLLLRPTDIDREGLIGELQALPRNNKPISSWTRRAEAFLDIAYGIRAVVETLLIDQDALIGNGVVVPRTGVLWNVPFRRNLLFTGREEVLHHIYEVLSLGHIAALSGLGGIGKTQIALEYAYRHRDEYQAVLWVRANTFEELIADFVGIAELLNLPERNAQAQDIIMKAVIQWFAEHTNWLFIFDNADDFTRVHAYLPPVDGGHILLTTRTQIMSGVAHKIEIKKMEEEEAVLLLLRRASVDAIVVGQPEVVQEIHAQAEEIAGEVDGLPLAIDQVGAYVEETSCSLSTYLMLYRKQHAQLLAYRGGIALDYPLSVSATWHVSFQEVKRVNPSASELLQLCAFFSADAIPEEILIEGAPSLGPSLESLVTDDLALNDAVKVLLKHSLLSRDPLNRTLTIHRLVQIIMQNQMDESTQKMWGERATGALDTVIPDVYKNSSHYPRYIAHALVCVDHIKQWNLESLKAAHLLNAVARYFHRYSQLAVALPLFQRALAIRERILGPEHPQVADTLSLLGHVFYSLGSYSEAALLYQRALTIYEKTRGPEHPHTLRAHYHLARLYRRQGRYNEAVMLYQKTYFLQEITLGPEHPRTVDSLRELAELYRRQGKYAEALPLLERVLKTQKKTLEVNTTDIALTTSYLARVYYNQEKYTEALPLATEALTIAKRELGLEDLTTATYRGLLAQIYRRQGNYTEALLLLQENHRIYEKALGIEHLHTANMFNELAQVYHKQGNNSDAYSYFQRALTVAERILQPDHPEMTKFLSPLAQFYRDQGKYTEALSLYRHTLTIEENILGREHPTTIKTREYLTDLLNKTSLVDEENTP
jgi:tetratricopeptide (TPR) repeat protein